jgi:hypothetical protein
LFDTSPIQIARSKPRVALDPFSKAVVSLIGRYRKADDEFNRVPVRHLRRELDNIIGIAECTDVAAMACIDGDPTAAVLALKEPLFRDLRFRSPPGANGLWKFWRNLARATLRAARGTIRIIELDGCPTRFAGLASGSRILGVNNVSDDGYLPRQEESLLQPSSRSSRSPRVSVMVKQAADEFIPDQPVRASVRFPENPWASALRLIDDGR